MLKRLLVILFLSCAITVSAQSDKSTKVPCWRVFQQKRIGSILHDIAAFYKLRLNLVGPKEYYYEPMSIKILLDNAPNVAIKPLAEEAGMKYLIKDSTIIIGYAQFWHN